MKLAKTFAPAALICLSAFGFQAHAAGSSTEDQIEARYDAAMERCEGLTGNQKDVCEQQAKAERDTAKADAEASETKREANQDAAEKKNEADYKVAKEKCDAMSGDAKDACVDQAKARYNR